MRSLLEFVNSEFIEQGHKSESNPTDIILGSLRSRTIPEEIPISVEKSEWVTLNSPTRLYRKYIFNDYRQMRSFIINLMDYQNKLQHHGLLTIEEDTVSIETYTHDVDDITELDLEMAKFSDQLYEDVGYQYPAREIQDDIR